MGARAECSIENILPLFVFFMIISSVNHIKEELFELPPPCGLFT